jgi:hypothetical protein
MHTWKGLQNLGALFVESWVSQTRLLRYITLKARGKVVAWVKKLVVTRFYLYVLDITEDKRVITTVQRLLLINGVAKFSF